MWMTRKWRSELKAGQCSMKCVSSSTLVSHSFQVLYSAGVLTYLPVSISREAEPLLNFARNEQ